MSGTISRQKGSGYGSGCCSKLASNLLQHCFLGLYRHDHTSIAETSRRIVWLASDMIGTDNHSVAYNLGTTMTTTIERQQNTVTQHLSGRKHVSRHVAFSFGPGTTCSVQRPSSGRGYGPFDNRFSMNFPMMAEHFLRYQPRSFACIEFR